MPSPTPELGLQKALDSDDTADYLDTFLSNSLTTLDGLFNNVMGHTHGGAHQGGPIGTIPATSIPDGSITSAKLADGGIQTIDLADGSVTTPKIADGSVTSAKIADATIATADIADGAITSAKIADGTIATADIADGAITSAKIADGTIATADIADAAITSAKIAASQVLTSPTINTGALASPTLSGTVSGAPTWANAQTFPASTKVGSALAIANNNPASADWRIDNGATATLSAAVGGNVFNISFGVAFAAVPVVVANVQGVSGGQATSHLTWWTGNVTASGFQLFVNNASGGGQSLECSWLALGH